MEDFEALKNSIDRFGDRISVLEQKMPVIEERYDHMNELIKQNVSVLEKLDRTLQDSRVAMEHITTSLETTKTKVTELDEEVDYIGQKVEDLKEERNFNFVQWVKNNLVSIIVGVALVYYIVMK